MNLAAREPVLTTAAGVGATITAVVVAGIGVLDAFHPDAVTQAQQGAIVAFLGVLWIAIGAVAVIARQLVTSLRNPRIAEGTTVTVVTPGDQPNRTTTV